MRRSSRSTEPVSRPAEAVGSRPLAVLVHPPHAKMSEPPPGPLVLAEHLRRLGAAVRVVDANLEVQEALLTGPRLAGALAELERLGPPPSWLTSARRAAKNAPRALARLRDPETWRSPEAYRSSLNALAEAYRLLSRATGSRLSLSDFECPSLSPLSSRDLTAAAEDGSLVPFAPELRALLPKMLAGSPRLVGVSAGYLSQVLPAFALAGMARRAGYRGVLVLGGGVAGSWASRLPPESPVFRVWDALVAGPGEQALTALLSGTPEEAKGASGLLAPGLGAWNPPAANAPVCFEPARDGLPWDRYPAPGPVLPLASSRGCYWARCAFCPEAVEGRQKFRRAPPDDLTAAILRARDSHGFRHVHLTDDAVPPAALRRLARGLRGAGVSWYGFARLEQGLLDPGFADDLAAGGCAMLQLGVETPSQRLLDLMGKGNRADQAGPILRNLARAGLRTYVYLLFGLPTETAEEARSTVAWAAEHRDAITFLNLALFHLPRGSDLERDAGRYGVTALAPLSAQDDLSLYWGYEGEGPTGRRELRKILSEARAHPALAPLLARTPPGFTSNHAAWAPL